MAVGTDSVHQHMQPTPDGGHGNHPCLSVVFSQIKFVYGCQPGYATSADSKLSQHVLEDIERQLKDYGYIQTINHHHIRPKNTKIDTRDNVDKLLHLQVEGNPPVHGLEEENL